MKTFILILIQPFVFFPKLDLQIPNILELLILIILDALLNTDKGSMLAQHLVLDRFFNDPFFELFVILDIVHMLIKVHILRILLLALLQEMYLGVVSHLLIKLRFLEDGSMVRVDEYCFLLKES